jgi:hypothetical protein
MHKLAILAHAAARVDEEEPTAVVGRCAAVVREDADHELLSMATIVAGCAALRGGDLVQASRLAAAAAGMGWAPSAGTRDLFDRIRALAVEPIVPPMSAAREARALLVAALDDSGSRAAREAAGG